MKAVNLIPNDSRRGQGTIWFGALKPVHGIVALLLVAVVMVTVYALEKHTISDRRAKLSSLQAQVSQTQAQAQGLQQYATYEQFARQQADTVRTIVSSRFHWNTALTELSRVIPAGTSLQSLLGSVTPGASVGGGSGGGAGTGGLRADLAVPAFEIRGCTRSQDEVAQLMSQLRLINGVTRVTLSDSQKASSAGGSSSSGGCAGNAPTFDLVVFFTAIPNAGVQGIVSTAGATGATGAAGASSAGTTEPVSRSGGTQ